MLKRKILTFEWITILAFIIQVLWSDHFSPKSSLLIFGVLLLLKYLNEGFRLNIFIFLLTQVLFVLSENPLLRLLMITLIILSVHYFPIFRFPQTMGLFFAGFKVLTFRNNIEVSVYYPTTTLTDPVPYTPSKKAWLRFHQYLLLNGSKLPSWIFHIGLSFLNHVEMPVQWESPIISPIQLNHGKKFPVILLSHGLACNRNLYTTFAREWASNGYIIFSVDHEETLDLPKNYTTKEFNRYRFTQVKKRKEAILRVLDYISKPDNIQDFFDTNNVELDLTKVSVVGQSFGGAAAAYTAMNDKRINGVCMLLDPDLECVYDELAGKSVNLPLLIIRTESSNEGNTTSGKSDKEMMFELVANNKEFSKQSLCCNFENSSHIAQTDLVLHMPRECMMLKMMKSVTAIEDLLILNSKLTFMYMEAMLFERAAMSGIYPSVDSVLKKYSTFAKKIVRKTKLIVDQVK